MQLANEEEKIVSIQPLDYSPDPRGLGWVLFESMIKNADNVAQIDGLTGQKDLYSDFLKRSVRLTLALRTKGISYGDVILSCSIMNLDSSIPILSAYFLGAVAVGIDEDFGPEDAGDIITRVKPKIMFVHSKLLPKIEKALENNSYSIEIVVYGSTDKYIPFSELVKPDPDEDSFTPVTAKTLTDPVNIFFTSGSTGLPKPVCYNHHATLYQCTNLIKLDLGWEVSLEYTSPYWSVFGFFFNTTVMMGNTRLIYPEFEDKIAWDFVKYNTSTMFLSTTEIMTMCKMGRPKNLSLDRLKHVLIGGNVLNENQLKKINEMFWDTRVLYMYGQSEVPGVLTSFRPSFENDLKLMQDKTTSVGCGLPGISYKIVDPKTENIFGSNEIGEIRIKTIFPASSLYLTDSTALFDNDGWLKTGDLGYYDEDKCFYVVGRLKDMFKFQCFKIISSTIQSVVSSHPAVDDAIVIGIPHEIDGEHPMAVVVLKESCRNVYAKDIKIYVDAKVHDSHRLRAGVKILDKFTKTPTGKVRKYLIRDLILQGKL